MYVWSYDVCTANRLANFTSVWSALRDRLITPTDLCNHLLRAYCAVIFEVQRYWILCLLQFCASYNSELLKALEGYKDTLCDFEKSASENVRIKLSQIDLDGELTELYYYDLQKAFANLYSAPFRRRVKDLTKSNSECVKESEIDDCLEQIEKGESIWTHILTFYDPKLPDKDDKLFLKRSTHPDIVHKFESQKQKYTKPFGDAKDGLLRLKHSDRWTHFKSEKVDEKTCQPQLSGDDLIDFGERDTIVITTPKTTTHSPQLMQMTENKCWQPPQNTEMPE
ncbi:unnamed protein product [Rodentolepis nana]|uniref:Sin3a_C domain-containing protein n=1 Tax=Rodentolepis nana TaxID=102285 RepID=A0A158QJI0_RODNA|nr:unnamed protein product [Rodentolepis nana]